MKNLTLDTWVKSGERTPATKGSYKTIVDNKYPTFKFFDCSETHKNDWIKTNVEWREVK